MNSYPCFIHKKARDFQCWQWNYIDHLRLFPVIKLSYLLIDKSGTVMVFIICGWKYFINLFNYSLITLSYFWLAIKYKMVILFLYLRNLNSYTSMNLFLKKWILKYTCVVEFSLYISYFYELLFLVSVSTERQKQLLWYLKSVWLYPLKISLLMIR